jgi:hypothetical protein
MPVAQSPAAHYINSSKGCPSITKSFPLGFSFSTVRHRRVIASGGAPLSNNMSLFWNLPYRIGLLRYSRISLDRFRE